MTPWQGAMTVGGTINRTAILLGLLVIAASFGWGATNEEVALNEAGQEVVVARFPALAMVGVFVGLAAVLVLHFKPMLAKFVGPVYALGFGFAVGAISKGYESLESGIVVQAAGATIAVFVVMLALYKTRVIKVTARFRRIVVTATIGIMVFYGVSLLMRLFGGEVPFLNEPSVLGIGLSVVICVVAAMNLALSFDFIEKGATAGLAKDFEWYGAFALVVTIVWLYLEMLRLLMKLQQR